MCISWILTCFWRHFFIWSLRSMGICYRVMARDNFQYLLNMWRALLLPILFLRVKGLTASHTDLPLDQCSDYHKNLTYACGINFLRHLGLLSPLYFWIYLLEEDKALVLCLFLEWHLELHVEENNESYVHYWSPFLPRKVLQTVVAEWHYHQWL